MDRRIWLAYGSDLVRMSQDIAAAAGLAERIGKRRARIGLKPNLVLASPADRGATTHPQIAEGVIGYLKESGFSDIIILEGSWVGCRTEEAFLRCGYRDLSKRTGVPLVDTKKDRARECDCGGLPLSLCDSAMKLDFLINLPVMKGHCQTGVTCALKNIKGLIPDREKRRFHAIGLHRPIAHLNAGLRQGFVLVDAVCGDLDFEEGGNPVPRGQLIGCYDPVLCDAYVSAQMGYSVEEIPYIGYAQALGVGCADLGRAEVIALNEPVAGMDARPSSRTLKLLSRVDERGACSACSANLAYALQRLNDLSRLGDLRVPIAIGQGWKGVTGELGVGSCTAAFRRSVGGCPPSGDRILRFLLEALRESGPETDGTTALREG